RGPPTGRLRRRRDHRPEDLRRGDVGRSRRGRGDDTVNHPELGRPPEGDWLGTPFVRLERDGSLARCTIDRPDRRNAMTGAMYFAVRYALTLLNHDDSLSGLLITGTGDVF